MRNHGTGRLLSKFVGVWLISALLLVGSQLAHATIPDGTYSGTNAGELAQNIIADCTGLDTLGLRAQNASFTVTFVNGVGSGQLKYSIPATSQSIGIQVSNLTGLGGNISGPFGISGSISVTTLLFSNGILRVVMQISGICGSSITADFSGDLTQGVAAQGGDTAGSDSNAHQDQLRDDIEKKGNAIAEILFYVLSGGILAQKETSLGITPIANGARVQARGAGGDFEYPWGAWAAYTHTDSEDDFAATAYDSDSDSLTVGADFQPWDNIVTGVALGYERNDIETTFNGGEEDLKVFSIIPYFGILMSEQVGVDFDLIADASFGYSFVDIDQFRSVGTARITSTTDADRTFFSANVTAGQAYGDWYLSGRTGILVAREETDGFTESDGTVIADRKTDFGQISVGGTVTYLWDSFEPFANVTYNYEYNREDVTVAAGPQPSNDSDDVQLGLGVRWYSDSGFTAAFEWNGSVAREDYDSNTFTFIIRGDF